eukprot:6594841-Prymnesium_polylepis.1
MLPAAAGSLVAPPSLDSGAAAKPFRTEPPARTDGAPSNGGSGLPNMAGGSGSTVCLGTSGSPRDPRGSHGGHTGVTCPQQQQARGGRKSPPSPEAQAPAEPTSSATTRVGDAMLEQGGVAALFSASALSGEMLLQRRVRAPARASLQQLSLIHI